MLQRDKFVYSRHLGLLGLDQWLILQNSFANDEIHAWSKNEFVTIFSFAFVKRDKSCSETLDSSVLNGTHTCTASL